MEQVNPRSQTWKVIVTFEGKAAVSLTKVDKDFEPLSSAAFEFVQQALRPLKKIKIKPTHVFQDPPQLTNIASVVDEWKN